MHPLILESLTQQRIEELHGAAPVEGAAATTAAMGEPMAGSGPIDRSKAKLGLWMVSAGSRLVADAGNEGDIAAASSRKAA